MKIRTLVKMTAGISLFVSANLLAASWSVSSTYTSGMQADYNGMTYEASWWTKGDAPGTQQWGPWKIVEDSTSEPVVTLPTEPEVEEPSEVMTPNTSGTWKASDVYTSGDDVTYNGKSFQASWWTQGDTPGSLQWGPWKEVSSTGTLTPTEPEVVEPTEPSEPEVTEPTEPENPTESLVTVDEHKVKIRLQALGMTEVVFEKMFPYRNAGAGSNDSVYSFTNFVKAITFYPNFINVNAEPGVSDKDSQRELAAFLANAAQETTGGWGAFEPIISADDYPQRYTYGMYFLEEVGCEGNNCSGYCDTSAWQSAEIAQACSSGKTFHGRGPIQLSWNYNYGNMGEALNLKDENGKNLLLQNPDLIKEDGVLGFRAALWFWMSAQAPKPSAHSVMTNEWIPSDSDFLQGRARGFGMTLNIINGGIECGKTADTAKQEGRMGHYRVFSLILGLNDPKTESSDVTYSTSSHLNKLSARKLGCNGLDKMNSY